MTLTFYTSVWKSVWSTAVRPRKTTTLFESQAGEQLPEWLPQQLFSKLNNFFCEAQESHPDPAESSCLCSFPKEEQRAMIYRLLLLPKIPPGLRYWEKPPKKSQCQICQSCASAALEIVWPESNIAQSHRGTSTAHRGSSHPQNRKTQQVRAVCSLCQGAGKSWGVGGLATLWKQQLPQRCLSALGAFRHRQCHTNVALCYVSYPRLTRVLPKSFRTKLAQSSLERKSWAELENTPKTLGDKASTGFPDEAFC